MCTAMSAAVGDRWRHERAAKTLPCPGRLRETAQGDRWRASPHHAGGRVRRPRLIQARTIDRLRPSLLLPSSTRRSTATAVSTSPLRPQLPRDRLLPCVGPDARLRRPPCSSASGSRSWRDHRASPGARRRHGRHCRKEAGTVGSRLPCSRARDCKHCLSPTRRSCALVASTSFRGYHCRLALLAGPRLLPTIAPRRSCHTGSRSWVQRSAPGWWIGYTRAVRPGRPGAATGR
jgi:hypothetical protein